MVVTGEVFKGIADAIREKDGLSDLMKITQMAERIRNIPSGGGSGGSADDVIFYDYDGTVVQTYSKEDFLALTSMPESPAHAGLIAQGWNWVLDEAKEYVAENGGLDIGAHYKTDDDTVRFYVSLDEYVKEFYIYFYASAAADHTHSLNIDWGDGTSDVVGGWTVSAATYLHHTYSNAGEYVIKLLALDGKKILIQSANNTPIIRSSPARSGGLDRSYGRIIHKIELPDKDRVNVNAYAFGELSELESITIPASIELTGSYLFNNCYSLKYVTYSGYSIGANGFYQVPLEAIALPNSITSINAYAFFFHSLRRIYLPSKVTTLQPNVLPRRRMLPYVTKIVGGRRITSFGGACIERCNIDYVSFNNSTLSLGSLYESIIDVLDLSGVTRIPTDILGNSESVMASAEKIIPPSNDLSEVGAYCQARSLACLEEIETNSLRIYTDSFSYNHKIKKISVGELIAQVGSAFGYSTLEEVEINTLTTTTTSIFANCYRLERVTLGGGVTQLPGNMFLYCTSLKELIVPSSVTSIGTYCFRYSGVETLDMSNMTSIPSLANVNAFGNMNGLVEIIVPDALYDQWITSTNWSSTSNNIKTKTVKKSLSRKYGGSA